MGNVIDVASINVSGPNLELADRRIDSATTKKIVERLLSNSQGMLISILRMLISCFG